ARRLSDFRRHPAPFAERVLVVLHMDHSVAVLLPQSGMVAADDSAIPVVPHADPLRHSRRLALEPAYDFADVRSILRVASVADDSIKGDFLAKIHRIGRAV